MSSVPMSIAFVLTMKVFHVLIDITFYTQRVVRAKVTFGLSLPTFLVLSNLTLFLWRRSVHLKVFQNSFIINVLNSNVFNIVNNTFNVTVIFKCDLKLVFWLTGFLIIWNVFTLQKFTSQLIKRAMCNGCYFWNNDIEKFCNLSAFLCAFLTSTLSQNVSHNVGIHMFDVLYVFLWYASPIWIYSWTLNDTNHKQTIITNVYIASFEICWGKGVRACRHFLGRKMKITFQLWLNWKSREKKGTLPREMRLVSCN